MNVRDETPHNMLRAVRLNLLLYLHIFARSKYEMFLLILNKYFVGSTRLLWIRVSLQSAVLCKHECHFVSDISQSLFCIFYKTIGKESVIICKFHTFFGHMSFNK